MAGTHLHRYCAQQSLSSFEPAPIVPSPAGPDAENFPQAGWAAHRSSRPFSSLPAGPSRPSSPTGKRKFEDIDPNGSADVSMSRTASAQSRTEYRSSPRTLTPPPYDARRHILLPRQDPPLGDRAALRPRTSGCNSRRSAQSLPRRDHGSRYRYSASWSQIDLCRSPYGTSRRRVQQPRSAGHRSLVGRLGACFHRACRAHWCCGRGRPTRNRHPRPPGRAGSIPSPGQFS